MAQKKIKVVDLKVGDSIIIGATEDSARVVIEIVEQKRSDEFAGKTLEARWWSVYWPNIKGGITLFKNDYVFIRI